MATVTPRAGGRRDVARTAAAGIDLDSAAFTASLQVALAELVIKTEAALWRLALHIQNIARTLAAVDTGRLRSSIQTSKGAGYVLIGTNVAYAVFVEFGTRYMAAQPFLRPALLMGATSWPAIARSTS